jgi:hypothetical protein
MFKYVFPKTNELTVFLLAVTLYSSIFYIPELGDHFLQSSLMLLDRWVNKLSFTLGIIDTSWFLIKTALISLIITVTFFGPLILPFTKKDLRYLCGGVILLELALIVVLNVSAIEQHPIVRQTLITYYSCWFFYALFIMRWNRNLNTLICNEQTQPKIAISLAFTSSIFMAILYFLFEWWWLDAYLTSVHVILLLYWLSKLKIDVKAFSVW